MPRAATTATSLTGVHGQSPQRIPPFLLISGRRVAAYVTKPNEDAVDGTNPLTSDIGHDVLWCLEAL